MFNPEISYFAYSNFRTEQLPFGILTKDKLLSIYCIGKIGVGKTTLLETLMLGDIHVGRGITLFDVHGDLSNSLLSQIPEHRKNDVVYIDAADPNCLWGYNPLRYTKPEYRPLLASGLLEVFKNMFDKSAWGAKMEHLLRMVILSLLSQQGANFGGIIRILTDDVYRHSCMTNIEDEDIRKFWSKEFPSYRQSDLLSIYNKVGAFLAHPSVKRILVTNTKQLSLRNIMDQNKILVLKISKGLLGNDVSYVLGSFFLSALSTAGFSRANIPEADRKYHFIYLDEFHNYTNSILVNMLSELRKYKIGLIMAHQYIKQINPEIREAVLGTVGTIISFRVGLSCAKHLAQEMYPVFIADDFINLENYDIYLKLMIQGKPSKAFSATTVPFKNLPYR